MKIKTRDIKKFFSLSNTIQQNNIIPILNYIKLSDGALTKTNLRTYIVSKIDVPHNESILLDEKVLSAFIKDSRSEEIEVSAQGNNVFLIEGKRKMKFQSADVKDFPALPEGEKQNEVEMDADTLAAIGVAVKSVAHDTMKAIDNVLILDGYCIGTDAAVFYAKKVWDIENMILDTETSNTISQFSSVSHYSSPKYNFFETDGTLYAFIKSEATMPNISAFIQKTPPDEYCEFASADFISFCDTVIASSVSKVLTCTMDGGKLSFNDPDYDIQYDIEIETSGTFTPKLDFLPRLFGAYFKSIKYPTIRLAKAEINNDALSVWTPDDENFSGLVIGLQP